MTRIPRRGPLPAPRVVLRRPGLLEAVAAAPFPRWQIAALCGIRHQARLSNLLHAASVPVTVVPLLARVAVLVGYPPDDIFVDTADAAPRLVKRADVVPANEAEATR